MIIIPIGTVLTSSTKTTSFNCQSSSSFLSNSPSLRGVIRFCRSKNHNNVVKDFSGRYISPLSYRFFLANNSKYIKKIFILTSYKIYEEIKNKR